jgi:phenylacetate-CoA ligase
MNPPLALDDDDRYPGLSADGRAMLSHLREHPYAPLYRNTSGHRLLAEDLAGVRQTTAEVLAADIGWGPPTAPAWLDDFVTRCRREVPRYRDYHPGLGFVELPTVTRAELGADIAAFVPDDVPLARMINFQTSGTTGHPLLVPSHPRVAASYLAYHRRALRHFGVELTARRGQVGVILLGFQEKCFTYVSVIPELAEAGLAKINLHPADWRDPAHPARYLEELAPEIIAGDPLSWLELLRLAPRLRPKALLSTSMTLLPGLRARLAATFHCPVLDLYSLNEAGPVGVFVDAAGGHLLLQPRMYVEILDADDRPVAPGTRGEVALTGGFNFCLPLLRYRTGDFATLAWHEGVPVLRALEGRPVVRFRRPDGTWLNNIDITHALRPLPLGRFALHQAADGALDFGVEAGDAADVRAAHAALVRLFGPGAMLRARTLPVTPSGKIIQYTSALPDASPA